MASFYSDVKVKDRCPQPFVEKHYLIYPFDEDIHIRLQCKKGNDMHHYNALSSQLKRFGGHCLYLLLLLVIQGPSFLFVLKD